MIHFHKVLVTGALLVSVSAFGGERLTPRQCNDYPFQQPVGEVTHHELMQELAELEAVGYRPAIDDPAYPRQINLAQKKLRQEFRRDGMGAAHS